ncbi:hypothetical protein GCM10009639_25830 [Kitasatospora putterlickiae]|uniref:Uncharacterized protein n=1 Tax=Kitasatospora putterlickiae TaxID=221725 RepID=A0ABN1XYL8_9ACTN
MRDRHAGCAGIPQTGPSALRHRTRILTVREAQEVGSVPGHSTDVPDHETVIRLPANMIQFIPRPDSEGNSGGNGGS